MLTCYTCSRGLRALRAHVLYELYVLFFYVVEIAAKIGQDIVDFGVSLDVPLGAKRSLFTTKNEGCNPPKKKRNDEVLFTSPVFSRLRALIMLTVVTENLVLLVALIYTVQICSIPSYSCPDLRKNGLRVLFKDLLFVLR